MNIQQIMKEAQKMQKQLEKTQNDLKNNNYEGKSGLVHIVINGNKEVISVSIDKSSSIDSEDVSMLEDMIVVAFNEAVKKVDADKEQKLGKYGSGLAGLM